MKRILLTIARSSRAAVGSAAIAPIFVTAAALALTLPAFAQSAADLTAVSDAGATAPPAIADPPADVPIDGVVSIAAADGESDDAAADHSGWTRSGDVESDSDSPPDRVLEVPQVADPANTGNAASAARDADASSQDQVGSIDDYQDEEDGGIGGVYIAPIPQRGVNPYGMGPYRANRGLNPPFGPGYIPFNPSRPNIARPGGNGMNTAVGSTSPMMPASRRTKPIPGGWWTPAH